MTIEVLYPELCNLYGDLMNAEFLARSCGAELVKTALSDTPKFVSGDVALLYMGGTTEHGQTIVRERLEQYREDIARRTESGGVTLVTGNAMEIFGEYIENEDGTREKMLGLFPIHSDRHMMNRYNSLYLGKLDDIKIVGFKSQFGHSYGDNGSGLFETIRGAGLNPEVKAEGIRAGNFMATYVIGPLMILNPPFAKYILKLMGVEEPHLEFEEAAMDVYETRLREFSEPDRGFVY
ncbi:MAG: hypothetical protein ACI3VB_04445 [Oscillospiraceae bacterium]